MKVLSTEGLTKLIDLIKSNFISSADTQATVAVDAVETSVVDAVETSSVDAVETSVATLATVATTGAYSDLSGTPTVDQTYDGTSTNAQSGVAVASAISGKANDSAVVHLAGDETIGGFKTFTGDGIAVINIQDTRVNAQTQPVENSYDGIYFYDKDDNRYACVETCIRDDGSNDIKFFQYGQDGTTTASFLLRVYNDGTSAALAPASDKNNSIVTTVSKTKSGNGGFKLGNGLIINFGHISSTNWSSNDYDVSYSIPFTTYGRIGFCRTSAAATTNDGGDYYARNPTTTGFNAYRTVTNTASIDWVAIGY